MFSKEEIEYIKDMTVFYLDDNFDNTPTAQAAEKIYQSILDKCNKELKEVI